MYRSVRRRQKCRHTRAAAIIETVRLAPPAGPRTIHSMPWEELLRLLAAMAAGAIIGFERELHDKPAGFRTNTLICIGAALFTMLSMKIGGVAVGDGGRVAAQIVTGIGFLGAGAILHGHGQVTGLTTAATIWAVAGIGMAFGAGQFAIGLIATLLVHGVLVVLVWLEALISRRFASLALELRCEKSTHDVEYIRTKVRELGLKADHWSVAKSDGEMIVSVLIKGAQPQIERLQAALVADSRVRSFSRR